MAQLNLADFSVWQGTPDYDVIKQANQIQGVIVKITEGQGYEDPDAARNLSELHRVSLLRGMYHFARPELGNTPEGEADWFTQIAKKYLQENDVFMFDWDKSWNGDQDDYASRYINKVKENLNNTIPLIYMNKSTEKSLTWVKTRATGAGLMLADYEDSGTASPWPFIAIRQSTSSGSLQGVSGNVDLDVFYGDSEMFDKYGYHAPQVVVPPTPDQYKITVHVGSITADLYNGEDYNQFSEDFTQAQGILDNAQTSIVGFKNGNQIEAYTSNIDAQLTAALVAQKKAEDENTQLNIDLDQVNTNMQAQVKAKQTMQDSLNKQIADITKQRDDNAKQVTQLQREIELSKLSAQAPSNPIKEPVNLVIKFAEFLIAKFGKKK